MDDKTREYNRICEKLGFVPSKYVPPKFETEDDSWVNPFSVLTIEELDFIQENGYLNHE